MTRRKYTFYFVGLGDTFEAEWPAMDEYLAGVVGSAAISGGMQVFQDGSGTAVLVNMANVTRVEGEVVEGD